MVSQRLPQVANCLPARRGVSSCMCRDLRQSVVFLLCVAPCNLSCAVTMAEAAAPASGAGGGEAAAGAGAVMTSRDPSLLRCRFYEKKFPDADEVVMVNVTRITQMGAYVTLLE